MKKSNSKAKQVKVDGVVMGMDLGDRQSSYAVVEAGGAVVEEGRVATTSEAIESLLRDRKSMRVVIETGTHSPWVSRSIDSLGHRSVVANSRKVKLISRSKQKRDRVDAVALARLGLAGLQLLSPVRHRSEKTQQHRTWLLARDTAVGARTQLINHIRGIVKSLGHRLPACSAEAFPEKVAPSVPKVLDSVVAPLMKIVNALNKAIRGYDKQIEALSRKHYPMVQQLRQIPGVGPITALAYVLTIEDHGRFRKSRTVGAYLGLVPGPHDSGDQTVQMHITKEGDVLMRRLLVNAAHYVLGRFGPDSDLRRFGQRIASRGGMIAKKRAVVAVARKLAVVLHKLWSCGVDYDPFYETKRRTAQVA